MIEGKAGKAGYCDAIMGREPNNPFEGEHAERRYSDGFTAGKETGVVFFAARARKEGETGQHSPTR